MDEPQYFADLEILDPEALRGHQRKRLDELLGEVLGSNAFYRRKLEGVRFDPLNDPLERLPFTTHAEIEEDQRQNPLYGTNLTYPLERYTRFHQTSGSSGTPVRWLDTPQSWEWFKRCWGTIFSAARVSRRDRVAFPFSFGPFIGFWAAFESAAALGNLCFAAGGMSTVSRLKLILDNNIDVICCTPTYALHMAETAREQGLDLRGSSVGKFIVAGEPGGSVEGTRRRIEEAWNSRVFDHTGMTEIGALGFECFEAPGGVHLNELECIPEVINPATGQTIPEGEPGELVLTNLGRTGSPLIRYRTGDQVRLSRKKCVCGRWFARMEGGIIGRIDDMFHVRGNNVFPTAIESIVRRFAEVAEFRVEAYDEGALTEIMIEIEPSPHCADGSGLAGRVARAVQETLSFRAQVRTVPPNSLPRFEMKARRFSKKSRR